MPKYISCQPAYGVNLNSQKDVIEHYNAGKDFMVLSMFHNPGSYISKKEVESAGDVVLEVRYGKNLTKVYMIPAN